MSIRQMLAIQLGRRIVEQKRGLRRRLRGKELDLRQQQDRRQQLLLTSRNPISTPRAIQPNGELGTLRPHLRAPSS